MLTGTMANCTFTVLAKKQPWASSLCHSLLRHTYVQLLLCCVKKDI